MRFALAQELNFTTDEYLQSQTTVVQISADTDTIYLTLLRFDGWGLKNPSTAFVKTGHRLLSIKLLIRSIKEVGMSAKSIGLLYLLSGNDCQPS